MRINKYLALRQLATRREADTYIEAGKVTINGRKAVLGDKVNEGDKVELQSPKRTYRYFAFNKPRGIVTHSPQEFERDVRQEAGIEEVFPLGRLDKESHGLIILTDDGRITDKLLNPDFEHDKEYKVKVREPLTPDFAEKMSAGLDIGGYVTRPCIIDELGPNHFAITLTEGKKHQIRRMCEAMQRTVLDLERTRVMNIKLGNLPVGATRPIQGAELKKFLDLLGFVG